MCSILGLSSDSDVAPTLVASLKRMEYRGYDSVGVAIKNGSNILVKKGVGKVNDVNASIHMDKVNGNVGIGHTRWATHGGVTVENAHPHLCNSGPVGVVHNGIIENYAELREDLEKNHNIVFKSTTDTEVIPNLLQIYFEKSHDVKRAIMDTVGKLKGHYAFVALFNTGELVGVRNHEPLIIGIGATNNLLLTSDIIGLPENISSVIYVDNNQFVIVKDHEYDIYDFEGNVAQFTIKTIPKSYQNVTKGSFRYYTEKEIFEQPNTILMAGEGDNNCLEKITQSIRDSDYVYVTGSGTSYNIAVIAKYLFSRFAGKKVEHVMASEMKYSSRYLVSDSTLFGISQSGESADILESVSIGKKKNAKILSMVNSKNSSLARESIHSIGLNCGPEVGVAATKSFTSQMAILYKIADKLCENCLAINFHTISNAYTKMLSNTSHIQELAKSIKNIQNLFVIGRGIHYPIAKEGALKIKEITYVHAEGIAGGELKHGPLALMDSSTYVIVINPDDDAYVDNISSVHEIKSREAKIIGISNKPDPSYDFWIKIPTIREELYPLIEIIPLQLISYYLAVERGIDPDYPKNLAKSVTVK
ncbi:MAG: glutamine--fructose-6-phosphate transaminase (isomerizing) [Nitrosopumilus sp.]|nr:glutamine--fructose-6-phosphate transaminase (isomerizing) [Nitrosopumilus sp.]MDH3823492.1 glutamine--fructose-6-phosphate transaminase (isomerizing) [Nitrosopumilus sp.]MDH3834321.1 glutamine--fructose-6-phosphate transaminase (isomerizing) [Nitrosopumilus sp.]